MSLGGFGARLAAGGFDKTKKCERCSLLYVPKKHEKCPHCSHLNERELSALLDKIESEAKGLTQLGYYFAAGAILVLILAVI